MGAQVRTVSYILEVDKEQCAKVNAEDKAISQRLTDERAERIATARFPTDEEIEELRNATDLTQEGKDILASYLLSEHYRVTPDKITAEFVKKYDSPKMKHLFYRLNRLSKFENINQSAYDWIKLHNIGRRGFSDEQGHEMKVGSREYESACELLIVLFALDIINICFDDYGRTTHFHKRYVARNILERRMDDVINYLMPHFTTLTLLFSLQVKDPNTLMKRAYTNKLQFINSILNSALGIKITSKRNDKMMNFMKPSDNFAYSVDDKKWVTTLVE